MRVHGLECIVWYVQDGIYSQMRSNNLSQTYITIVFYQNNIFHSISLQISKEEKCTVHILV